MITPERWEQLRPIVEAALELSADEVPAFLDEACRDRPDLRREADDLLRAATHANSSLGFLDSPAADLAAPLLTFDEAPGNYTGELAPGATLGTYTVERRLGSGGMGVVYLAHDERLERKVAIKLLPPWLAATEAANRRFMQEAKAASRLDHPNIQTVHEIGETADGRLFIAMAHYDGETLQDRIARGPLAWDAAVDVATQIAAGLAAAHARNIVHSDIKPGNVIVTAEGVAKIVDFGAAKITDRLSLNDSTYGTVAYMSPEQTRGEPVDAGTDIWALGVVLYEMLTGMRPFGGESRESVVTAIRDAEPDPIERYRADVPNALSAVAMRCLAKDRSGRYQSAAELLSDLRRTADLTLGSGRRRRWLIPAAAAAAMLLTAFTGLVVRRNAALPGAVVGPATSIAVMPPVPISPDSALTRVGRELTVMLSANLDGMGGIRTLPALTMLAQTADRTLSLEEKARLARRLGATSFLNGTLVRAGTLVRVDVELLAVTSLEPIARASASAAPDDVTALTDSATILLLREVWLRGGMPVPRSAEVTTQSVPALRAYLEGELAFARGEFGKAVPAFERAFAADSTFALAYWRSIYPRVYEGSRPDSSIVAGIVARRERLPVPEQLMLDAYLAPTLSERMRTLHEVTTRFASFWPGWYSYADALFHHGPYLGRTQAEALQAMRRTVELNPDFAPARQHLLWIAVLERDSTAADSALAGLERFAAPGAFMYHPDNMTYFRALHALVRSNGEFSGDEGVQLARVALSGAQRVPPPEITAVNLLTYGFPRAQLQQVDATLRQRTTPEVVAAQWMGKAFASATRGAWDSALVAADRWARVSNDPDVALRAYGLAVLGVSSGAVEPRAVLRLRPSPSASFAPRTDDWMAELAWLDGIRAYAERNLAALTQARRVLTGSNAKHAALLRTSLQSFEHHAGGNRTEATRLLTKLEWDFAERRGYLSTMRFHPYLSAVHRPAAARWLGEAGDTLQALRLLSWYEAILAGDGDRRSARVGVANRTVAPIAMYERARLEDALGRVADARDHYRDFLERYDLPPAQHVAMVERSRAALQRLEQSAR
jgi:TolB-like protein